MGRCLPFSEIDVYLKGASVSRQCLADTNFLIAISDKDHSFHEDAQFFGDKLADYQFAISVSVTARAEFIDHKRKVIVTEALMDMLSPTSKWKLSSAVREILKSQKGWIDNQARMNNDPYLSDARIKICKQTFLPKTQSGQIGWVNFCQEYLHGRLVAAWDLLVERLLLNYIDMRADDTKQLFRKDLDWKEMYRLSEESALGSQDAMILNLLDSSVFPFVVTSDFDLAYGTLLSTTDKVAFVPDSLFRDRIKKLRF